jgi:hypothetical protein
MMCLDLIEHESEDSMPEEEAAFELTVAEIQRFRTHVRGLNKLINQLRERCPEAQYYLACSMAATLNILSGSSHEGARAVAQQDRVVASLILEHADGGDW